MSARSRTTKIIRLLENALGVPRRRKKRSAPLDMLIGTLLSQNTNDKNSHRAYLELRKRFPTWRDVAEAPVSGIASAIKIGGMKNVKSKRIKELLRNLRERNGSYRLKGLDEMSDDEIITMLMGYEGIGFKTAACVLLFALRREVFPVDTHIHRICNRLGLVETRTPEKTFEAMRSLLPKGKSYSFHTNLIRFGRSVCHARNPCCGDCPLYDECESPEKETLAARGSRTGKKADTDFMLLDEI